MRTFKVQTYKYLIDTDPTENSDVWAMLCSHYFVICTAYQRKPNDKRLKELMEIAKKHNIEIPNEHFKSILNEIKILSNVKGE